MSYGDYRVTVPQMPPVLAYKKKFLCLYPSSGEELIIKLTSIALVELSYDEGLSYVKIQVSDTKKEITLQFFDYVEAKAIYDYIKGELNV